MFIYKTDTYSLTGRSLQHLYGYRPTKSIASNQGTMVLQYPWEIEVKTLNSLCTVKPGQANPPRLH